MSGSYRSVCYLVLFCFLLLGSVLFFLKAKWLESMGRMVQKGQKEMEEASGKRMLDDRKRILRLQERHSVWNRIERELHYSGLKNRLPFLTAEAWVAANVFLTAVLTIVLLAGWGWTKAALGAALFWGAEFLFLYICKVKNFQSVNSNLIKFLDFLGNYSVTSGELTGIFTQISRYVDEPMRSVLEECSYEAQTTGDISLALLVMAEKIEHPRFKELARNMEINVRYCADFTLLVNSSRKSLREYLRLGEEKRSMLREAVINMALLLIMSGFTLVIVDRMTEFSVLNILTGTLPGRIAMGVVGFILLLFTGKLAERR